MVSANHSSLNAYSNCRSMDRSCGRRGGWVKPWLAALELAPATLLLTLAALAAHAAATHANADPPSCKVVRFSDVGWTDVTATTALTTQLLRNIGYAPTITVLSVPVTFASVHNNDIDVFLGNWMPMQEADRGRYVADGSVVIIKPNLQGAKYTLAVPSYTYAQGRKDFKDIQRFAPAVAHSI
jgi:glycine betaine/proline transport system substrate-binding protein